MDVSQDAGTPILVGQPAPVRAHSDAIGGGALELLVLLLPYWVTGNSLSQGRQWHAKNMLQSSIL